MKDEQNIDTSPETSEAQLREALEASGQRFTEQRAAVYRYLVSTDTHPTADEVLVAVRGELPTISLATVYKSLETLVGCGLALKLNYTDDSSRYDGRTDPHHHARCLACGKVRDLPGELPKRELEELRERAGSFTVVGYRFELSGYCADCLPEGGHTPLSA
ncbi:MAG: transcriptional repressor [Gemmatimonadota bacterium]|nr:transcriptional repressor [Gemmatimonadota bacterium]